LKYIKFQIPNSKEPMRISKRIQCGNENAKLLTPTREDFSKMPEQCRSSTEVPF
jgi:hypothetical protein